MDYDHSYKLLFSHHQMVADLLRGFIPEDWVHSVDFTTLERVYSSHISTDLRERHNDILWRLQWQHGTLYIYLLLEFQSTVDLAMAIRIQIYTGLLYEGLLRSGERTPEGKLPPIVPIVLYNGQRRWTAALDVAELIEDVPGGLAVYQPHQRYLLIDESRYGDSQLAPMHNLVAALFRLEQSNAPTDVQRILTALIAWLQDPQHESLRRAFTVWLKRVLLPGRLPTVTIPEVHDLEEMQSMLAERVLEWTQQWKEEGLQQGLQQALAAERVMLLRQTQKRFGEACALSLAPLLETRVTPEAMTEVGEWIVTYDTGEELLARVRAEG